MKMETTFDMTIPIWGVLGAVAVGTFYIISMKFELDYLKKELTELKAMIHELILKDK